MHEEKSHRCQSIFRGIWNTCSLWSQWSDPGIWLAAGVGCGGGDVLRLIPKAPARDSEVLAWVWVFFYRSTPNTSALGLVPLVSGPPFWAPESQLMPCSDAPWSSALSSALFPACVAWPHGRSYHQCRAGGKPPSTHHHRGWVILGMLQFGDLAVNTPGRASDFGSLPLPLVGR